MTCELLSEILTIIVSGVVGAILGMFIDAFFKVGLWSSISYWAKRARLHSKSGIRIEMRRSVEIDVSDVPASDFSAEMTKIRDLLFRKCQSLFENAEKVGETVVKAVAKSDQDVELEFNLSGMPEDETQDQNLMIVMISRTVTSYKELVESYSGLWPQLAKMSDTVNGLGYSVRTGDGRASLTVNLKESLKTLTQTSKIGISGFTSDRGAYQIKATEKGIVFDGEFSREMGHEVKDFVIWFY